MATSGSSDFTITRNDVINAALRICRAYTIGESAPEAEQVVNASEALNLLLKNLVVRGGLLWTMTEGELYLSKGQASYLVGPSTTSDLQIVRPTRILDARVTEGDTEIPIQIIGRNEYFDLTSKESQGRPTQLYYDRQLTDGTLYVYPTPDDSGETIKFTYERVIEDFDAAANNPDFPPEWFRALKWMLAAEIAIEYGIAPERIAYIEQKASMLERELLEFEVEPYTQMEPYPEDYDW